MNKIKPSFCIQIPFYEKINNSITRDTINFIQKALNLFENKYKYINVFFHNEGFMVGICNYFREQGYAVYCVPQQMKISIDL